VSFFSAAIRLHPLYTQRKGGFEPKGDLNVRLKKFCANGQKPLRLALFPVAAAQGPQGSRALGARLGRPPTKTSPSPTSASTVGTVRCGCHVLSLLGSPAGSTTGGSFRFSCALANGCDVTVGAVVISSR